MLKMVSHVRAHVHGNLEFLKSNDLQTMSGELFGNELLKIDTVPLKLALRTTIYKLKC